MRKKLLVLLVLVCFSTTSLLAFAGCDNKQDSQNNPTQIEQIYEQYVAYAQEEGVEPLSYEEWLASIKGEKGETGATGKDGITPKLRINEETNYWEVSYDNGSTWESLDVKATGDNGQDGANGSNGLDGIPGKDGITPKLRINEETNYWEVSYDNGSTWESLDVKATGDNGQDGANGSNGKDGTNGTSLLTGRGKPTSDVGMAGDSYIDLSTWNFYVKTVDGWEFNGNIKGDDGEDGDNSSPDYTEFNGSYRLSHIKVGDSIYNLGDNFFGMTLYPERICTELENGIGTMSFDFGNYFSTNITYYTEDNDFIMVCEDEVDLYNNGKKQKELVMSMEEIDGKTYFVLSASNGYLEFSYYVEKLSLTLEDLAEKYNEKLIAQAKSMAGSMIGNFEVVVLNKQETIENIQNYTFDSIETDKIVAGLFVKFDVTNNTDGVLFTIYYNFGLQFSEEQTSNIMVTYDGSEYWYLEVVEENKTIVFEYSVTA